MHPQMPEQQYMPNGYGLFSSPHLHPSGNALPHPAHAYLFNPYDQSTYPQDPYAQFEMSKSLNHFQYVPNGQSGNVGSQYPQAQSQSPQMNNYTLSSSNPMTIYQTPGTQTRTLQQPSLSREDSSSTPNSRRQTSLRVPKFERTYTDAIEDELYDETAHNSGPGSTNHDARLPASSFAFENMQQYPSHLYVDKATGAIHHGTPHRQQTRLPHSHSNGQQHVTSGLRQHDAYDPLHHSQQISSAAVADSVRRLKVPNRTTVSPREAFLDYPDNADFSEKRLFSSSASPYSNGHDSHEIPGHHDSESTESNEEEFQASDSVETTQSMPVNSTPYLHDSRMTAGHHIFPHTSSRSNSTSTRHSGLHSSDVSQESSNSSESEYDPTASRRPSRSSGRGSLVNKTFSCVDCGKRFDKSQTLQTHRRNSHGKATGPPTLSGLRFSNTSHRCDYVDATTGKMCSTVFSRPYDLIRHYETKHAPKRQEFICPHCKDRKSFSRSDALRRHLRVKHPSSSRK